MRVLTLAHFLYDTSPSQRYRLEQWEPLLRAQGVQMTFVPFEDQRLHHCLHKPGNLGRKIRYIIQAMARRVRLMRTVRDYDVVVVHREAALVGPAFLEKQIHKAGVPLVYDFDDAIFLSATSKANKYWGWLRFNSKTRDICALASHVMVGNEYLADYARQANSNVTIIPPTIDTSKYTLLSNRVQSEVPVIGWSGTFTTVQYLDELRVVFQRLAKTEKFKLRVIGAPDYTIEGVDVEGIDWHSATEVEDLRPLDIGVMPLPDNEWTRGKCGMKALQYMGIGVPAVCSPVGVNSKIIRDGENGFLATTDDEWVEKLTKLLRSAQLRKEIGLAGRREVEEKYSATAQAPHVYEILKMAANKKQSAQ